MRCSSANSAYRPPLCDQLVVRAALDHAPLVHDDDAVAARGRCHAMRDQDHAALGALAVDGLENALLRAGIDGAQRVVQNEDLRLRDERAGERHALLLPARELHAALADHRVEAVRQPEHLLEDVRLGGRLADRHERRRRVGLLERVADVATHGGREQKRRLLRVADAAAHDDKRQIADVVAVEEHAAVRRRLQPRQEHRQRRLAAARAPHNGQRPARRQLEAHVVEHGLVAVGERQVLHLELTLDSFRRGQRAIDDVRHGVEHHLQARVGCATALHHAHQKAERDERPGEARQRPVERQEAALGELTVQHQVAAVPEHDHDADGADRLHDRPHRTAQPRQRQALFQIVLVPLFEVLELAVLEREGAHDAHAGNTRLHPLAHAPDGVLVFARARVHLSGEAPGHHDEQRQRRQRRERQLP